MNQILFERYGEDMTTFESVMKTRFKKKLVAFYEAHNPDHSIPDKMAPIIDYYFERQDKVSCASPIAVLPRLHSARRLRASRPVPPATSLLLLLMLLLLQQLLLLTLTPPRDAHARTRTHAHPRRLPRHLR